MKFIKYLLLFLLIYLDPISIGYFKWAQIWKIIILLFLFLFIKKTKQNKLSKLYFLLAIISLINVFIFDNFINEFGIFIKNLLLQF
jgi:asparagine N-glycosylation enzyme membrane subunit Stt3